MKKRIIIISMIVLHLFIIGFIGCYAWQKHVCNKLIDAIVEEDEVAFESNLKKLYTVNMTPSNVITCFLIKHTFDTPLQAACEVGNFYMVQRLLEEGADVNYIHPYISPVAPLLQAASSSSLENYQICKLLISEGADVQYTYLKHDALYLLLDRNSDCPNATQIVDLLVENGANIYQTNNGYTLLHEACYWENTELIQLFISKYQLPINSVSPTGETPLLRYCTYVVKNDEQAIQDVEFLINNGADLTHRNQDGKTAYDYAMEQERYKLAELLKPEQSGDGSTIDTASNFLS